MDFGDFDALSFDCYGTLIDWEAGIAAVLGPWARDQGLDLTDEALLTAYSVHEASACVGSGAGTMPSARANWIPAAKHSRCGLLTASNRPSS